MRRLTCTLIAGLVSVATFGLVPGHASAGIGQWSTPVKVSGDTRHAWFPDVAADDSGNAHIIWSAEYPKPPRLQIDALWYTRGNGQTWTRPTDFAVIYVGHALRNALDVDAAGRLHVLYRGFGSLEPPDSFNPPRSLGPEDVWYTSTNGDPADGVKAWQPSRELTRKSGLGYYSDIKVDSRGVLHAIWTEADDLGWGLYYASSSDGGVTWSERVALDSKNQVWWYRAQLEVDAHDRLHVAWEVTDLDHLGRTRAAFYGGSSDGGRNWTTVQMGGEVPRDGAPNDVAGPQQPAIGVDGTGQILFVYREEKSNRILYRVSSDGTRWSTPQPMPSVKSGIYRPYDVYDMVTDSAGHVHLAFVGYPEGSDAVSLMHSEWDGSRWSTPDVVTSGAPFPEYPRLAISTGNRLHLVWFGGDQDSIDRLAVGVWYSTAGVAAPRTLTTAAPVPLPAQQQKQVGPVAPPPPLPDDQPRMMLPATAHPGDPEATDGTDGWLRASSLPLYVAVLAALLMVGLAGLVVVRRDARR